MEVLVEWRYPERLPHTKYSTMKHNSPTPSFTVTLTILSMRIQLATKQIKTIPHPI
jgi:hypothetical protein